jgi:hypothetical protein
MSESEEGGGVWTVFARGEMTPFNPPPQRKLREVSGEGACDRAAREDAASKAFRRRAKST